MTQHVHSFCWHNVEGTWCFPGDAGGRRLHKQLAWLARTTNVMDLGEVVRRLRDGDRLPPRTVTITFDDGYADNLAVAVPVLERLGIPATFFLVPGLLSREADPWWERLSQAVALSTRSSLGWQGRTWSLAGSAQRERTADALRTSMKGLDRLARQEALTALVHELGRPCSTDPRELFLDWDGARDLVARGFAVGSHTWHHGILARETPEEQHDDLARARAELQESLQVPADLLAYPNGGPADYDTHSVAAARAVGHSGACTTTPGASTELTPPYELHRYVMSPRRGVLEFAKVLKHAGRRQGAGATPASAAEGGLLPQRRRPGSRLG